MLCLALLPLALFLSIHPQRLPQVGLFGLGPAILLVYGIFFVLRGAYLIAWGFDDLMVPLAEWRADIALRHSLWGLGATMLCFVAAYFSPLASRWATALPHLATGEAAPPRAALLAIFFLLMAYLGQSLLFVEHGGVGGLIERYIRHTKVFETSTRERLGLMLWHTFHAPGVWLLGLAFLNAYGARRHLLGWLLSTACAVGAAAAAFAFGSRMQLLALFGGLLLIFHWHWRRIPTAWILVSAPLLVFTSVWLVAARTGVPVHAVLNLTAVLGNLGHGVLDVVMAMQVEPIPRDYVTAPERWLQVPLWLIPRVLWPAKPVMGETRLDWLVADYYRSGGHMLAQTGFPSSMFAEWHVLGGWLAVVLAGAFVGFVASILDQWYSHQTRNVATTIIYVSLFVAGVLYFKDGDLVMSTVGTIKSLALVTVVCVILGARLVPGPLADPGRASTVPPRAQ